MEWKPYLEGIPPGDLKIIEAMQSKMEIELPRRYVDDLIRHPGDIPSKNIVKIDGEEYIFGPLLYIGGKATDTHYSYSIEWVIERIAEWHDSDDDYTKEFWPFGKDLSTGYYCFENRKKSAPRIVFINKQYDPDEKGAVTPLAQSYEQFMESLT